LQAELPSQNRPNSTLERAAPYIRSLGDGQAETKKKPSESTGAAATPEGTNQTFAEQPEQEQPAAEAQPQGNLSFLIKD
jgi:hypothetical protein